MTKWGVELGRRITAQPLTQIGTPVAVQRLAAGDSTRVGISISVNANVGGVTTPIIMIGTPKGNTQDVFAIISPYSPHIYLGIEEYGDRVTGEISVQSGNSDTEVIYAVAYRMDPERDVE